VENQLDAHSLYYTICYSLAQNVSFKIFSGTPDVKIFIQSRSHIRYSVIRSRRPKN